MSKPWTLDDDDFLMSWHGIGIDFIGEHDLGRTPKATRARWKFLNQSGARMAYAEAMIAMHHAAKIMGHEVPFNERGINYWEQELELSQ